MQSNVQPGYRADIDGLRGLAVLAVLMFHANQSWLPGGYLAVDAFFVVSGYLIFGQLWREYSSAGRIDIVGFWLRRLKRIAPLATLVIFAVTVFVFASGKTSHFIKTGNDGLYALVYLTNYYEIALNGDYFRIGEDLSLFQHFWFVAVEMQFYAILSLAFLLLPTLMRVLNAKLLPFNVVLALLVVGAILSFAIHCVYLQHSQSLGYYATAGRLWQFLVGAIAYHCASRFATFNIRQSYVSVIALALICAPMLIADQSSAQNQWTALWPTLGASLFVVREMTGSVTGILTTRFFRNIGHISYGLYLWHWPCQKLLEAGIGEGALAQSLALACTVLFAVFSYHYVEKPCRRNGGSEGRRIASVIATSAMIVSVAAVSTLVKREGVTAQQNASLPGGKLINLTDFLRQMPAVYGGAQPCHLDHKDVQLGPCIFGDPQGTRTLYLFGDSHAAQWFPALEKIALRRSFRLISHTKSSCPPLELDILDARTGRRDTVCGVWRTKVIEDIKAVSPDLLIVGSYSDYASPLNGVNSDAASDLMAKKAAVAGLVTAMAKVKVPMLLVEDHAVLMRDPIACVLDKLSVRMCSVNADAGLLDRFPWLTAQDLSESHVRLASFNDTLCSGGICPAFDEDHLRYRDRSHLAAPYVLTLEKAVETFLFP
jgi:peptidoglycan/LPS O-acetylase OafA/YrhL